MSDIQSRTHAQKVNWWYALLTLGLDLFFPLSDPMRLSCRHESISKFLTHMNPTRRSRAFHTSRSVYLNHTKKWQDNVFPIVRENKNILRADWINYPGGSPLLRTVSPNSWKRARSPRKTPAVTGPQCNPTRNCKSSVSGPSSLVNCFTNELNFCKQSRANRLQCRQGDVDKVSVEAPKNTMKRQHLQLIHLRHDNGMILATFRQTSHCDLCVNKAKKASRVRYEQDMLFPCDSLVRSSFRFLHSSLCNSKIKRFIMLA
jgi:hypothetical protein